MLIFTAQLDYYKISLHFSNVWGGFRGNFQSKQMFMFAIFVGFLVSIQNIWLPYLLGILCPQWLSVSRWSECRFQPRAHQCYGWYLAEHWKSDIIRFAMISCTGWCFNVLYTVLDCHLFPLGGFNLSVPHQVCFVSHQNNNLKHYKYQSNIL